MSRTAVTPTIQGPSSSSSVPQCSSTLLAGAAQKNDAILDSRSWQNCFYLAWFNMPSLPWNPFGFSTLPRRFPRPRRGSKRQPIVRLKEWKIIRGDTVSALPCASHDIFIGAIQNTGPLKSTSFTCASVLYRTRHNTTDAILIQWEVNKWPCIL